MEAENELSQDLQDIYENKQFDTDSESNNTPDIENNDFSDILQKRKNHVLHRIEYIYKLKDTEKYFNKKYAQKENGFDKDSLAFRGASGMPHPSGAYLLFK